MKSILDIYSEYKIMKNLQEHQLRVAAVAKLICDSQKNYVDTSNVIIATLLHDMGNILKFDLSYFPEFTAPEGLEYWISVKKSFFDKYGEDEHNATIEIAKEIGISETAFLYLNAVGFSKVIENVNDSSLEKKICCYADQRVGPYGVLYLEQRLSEARERYKNKPKSSAGGYGSIEFEQKEQSFYILEQQIFKDSNIIPADITDKSIERNFGELHAFVVTQD